RPVRTPAWCMRSITSAIVGRSPWLTKAERSGVKSPFGSRVRDTCCTVAGGGAAEAGLLVAAAVCTDAAGIGPLAAIGKLAGAAALLAVGGSGVAGDINQ
ncbi:MAG TPA: hypothetical protein VNU71_11085, partial [Burkholderiaceae bacterium]|nr:hypothetical protein [Burkholderiaceae bacterium]